MRKVWVIAAREYKAAVKTKSFLIGIILLPIMMGGGIVAQALFKDQVDLRPKHFAIVDRTPGGEFFPLLAMEARRHNDMQAAADPQTKATLILQSVPPPAPTEVAQLRLALSERVRRGELTGFLEIGPEILMPLSVIQAQTAPNDDESPDSTLGQAPALDPHALRYQTNRPFYRDFSKWAEALINSAVRAKRAGEKDIALSDFSAIAQPVPTFSKSLATRDPRTGAIDEGIDQNPIVAMLLPGGLVILMFMMVLLGAAPLLQGVMEEKMQRIAEVLLGSVQPFPLMMGKISGMAAVSLTMASIYLVGIYWAVQTYGYGEYLSTEVIAWFLLYQVLALFLYGSVYAAVGAACTDLKEAQTMMMPVTLIIMIPVFIWVNVVTEPTSTFATSMSLFPLATPMLMIGRLAVPPGIPFWQPVLGVVLVLATALLCVYAAGRIFRVGLLLQGKGARFTDLCRWVIRG
jgi:ABC-2 type transport system permease protein